MLIKCLDAESQYAANNDLKKEDIQNLQEWLKIQPHIPEIDEFQLQLFHHSCYYSNELTKKTIDYYYTIRTHAPELFACVDTRRPELLPVLKSCVIEPLDKLTPEGYGIVYVRLIDINPDVFNFNECVKVFGLRTSLWLKEVGCLNGQIIVIDMTGGKIAHLMKVSITTMMKLIYYLQSAIPFRLMALHLINPVSFVDKLLAMMKPFVRKELFHLIQVHASLNDFDKIVPRDCLPKELGGNQPSIQALHKRSVELLLDNADLLISEEKDVVDETKRPGKPKNSGDIFGVEGTFKKLDID